MAFLYIILFLDVHPCLQKRNKNNQMSDRTGLSNFIVNTSAFVLKEISPGTKPNNQS